MSGIKKKINLKLQVENNKCQNALRWALETITIKLRIKVDHMIYDV